MLNMDLLDVIPNSVDCYKEVSYNFIPIVIKPRLKKNEQSEI